MWYLGSVFQQSPTHYRDTLLSVKSFNLCLVSFVHNENKIKMSERKLTNSKLNSYTVDGFFIYIFIMWMLHIFMFAGCWAEQVFKFFGNARDTHVELERMKMVEWSFTQQNNSQMATTTTVWAIKWNTWKNSRKCYDVKLIKKKIN